LFVAIAFYFNKLSDLRTLVFKARDFTG